MIRLLKQEFILQVKQFFCYFISEYKNRLISVNWLSLVNHADSIIIDTALPILYQSFKTSIGRTFLHIVVI